MPSLRPAAKPWKLRALRFDFAPEAEAEKTIGELIQFAKEWHFNTIVLHLDRVVRTPSLDHFSAETTYRPEQIHSVVKRAEEAGLDVVPVVGTLGHAEHLLQGAELRPLLRAKPHYRHLFCPSEEAVYEKLEDYFGELAGLFPGRDIHIGGDESWALGACPACRERFRRGEAAEDIFISHLLRLHRILHRLGKRAWIWDDVFDGAAAEKISQLPRDIVICSDAVASGTEHPSKASPFHRYLAHGFEVIACPWARSIDNISQISTLAGSDDVLGGLVSVWDLTTSFWPAFLPGVAYAGTRWNEPAGDADSLLWDALEKLLPSLNDETLHAVWSVLNNPYWNAKSADDPISGLGTLEEQRDLYSFILHEELMHRAVKSLPVGLERSVLVELHTHVRQRVRDGMKRGATSASGTFPPAAAKSEAASINTRGPALPAVEDWIIPAPETPARRASLYPSKRQDRLDALLLEAIEKPRPGRALLTVRLSLASSRFEPTLKIEAGRVENWQEIYLGTFKPFNPFVSIYNFQMPLAWNAEPFNRLRFTVWNAGQKGILYAWISLSDRTLRLLSPGETPVEMKEMASILVDHNGTGIHGFPNSLRKASESSQKDRAIVEMVLI